VKRGEIRYAVVGGSSGRRPVLLVTASEIIPVLSAVTCAPITTTLRGIATRVTLGRREGMGRPSEAACDALMTISKTDIDAATAGALAERRFPELDRAIARALDIRKVNLPLA
jgi:mRNA interferase MazF